MSQEKIALGEKLKVQLRAEEIFREEVRQELRAARPPKRGWTRAVEVLNTPLILWFLSSVVLGSVGWSYTAWEERRANREATRQAITKLDMEIYGRLRKAARRLKSAKDHVGITESIDMLDEGSGIFPEFEDKALEGLFVSLTWLVEDDQKAVVDNARDDYLKLLTFRNPTIAGRETDLKSKIQLEYFDGVFAIRQWRD